MSVLICFALKEEAAPFHKVAARHPGVITLIVGIGSANAEKSVRSFLPGGARTVAVCQDLTSREQLMAGPARLAGTLAPPSLVLTCGFAGGLNPDLKLGDVVFEIENRRDEFHESQTKNEARDLIGDSWNSSLRAKLLAAGAKPAKIHCADHIATTVAEKQALRAATGADVVEMESGAIAAVCAEKNISCVTVRVISDTANEALPLDFNALAKADKSIDFGKLAWAIAKSPGKIGALMQLQKKTKFAAQQLADTLAKIISA
jgi:adenosylhomocysteine nucleosidase